MEADVCLADSCLQIFPSRYADIQISRYADIQISRYADMQIYRYTDMQHRRISLFLPLLLIFRFFISIHNNWEYSNTCYNATSLLVQLETVWEGWKCLLACLRCCSWLWSFSSHFDPSAEFPSLATLVAQNKCCHWLVRRPGEDKMWRCDDDIRWGWNENNIRIILGYY